MVLITQLPPGSRLLQARGGPAAWSDEVTAIHREGHLIRANITSVLGAKKPPKAVEPPEAGWKQKAAKSHARNVANADRLRRKRKLNRRTGAD